MNVHSRIRQRYMNIIRVLYCLGEDIRDDITYIVSEKVILLTFVSLIFNKETSISKGSQDSRHMPKQVRRRWQLIRKVPVWRRLHSSFWSTKESIYISPDEQNQVMLSWANLFKPKKQKNRSHDGSLSGAGVSVGGGSIFVVLQQYTPTVKKALM